MTEHLVSATAGTAAALPAVAAAAPAVGLTLTVAQLERLARYRGLVLEWNERFNLTAIREGSAFERLHLVDALGFLRGMEPAALANGELVDIGSGAGLPGLPLAIVMPAVRVTLLEATGKKANFLRLAAAELGLDNVSVIHARAEEIAHQPAYREHFNLATARAIGSLATLVELALPLLRVGGRLLAAKKLDAADELTAAARACRLLGGAPPVGVPLALAGLEDRQVVVVAKRQRSPAGYPRRPGLPAHDPL